MDLPDIGLVHEHIATDIVELGSSTRYSKLESCDLLVKRCVHRLTVPCFSLLVEPDPCIDAKAHFPILEQ